MWLIRFPLLWVHLFDIRQSIIITLAIAQLPASTFDYVLSRPSSLFSPPFIQFIFNTLKSGGFFISSYPTLLVGDVNESSLVLGGFVDTKTVKDEQRIEIVGQKPSWDAASSSAPIKLKKKTPAPAAKGQLY